MLEVRDLSFHSDDPAKPLFGGLAFALAPGDALALTGPPDSGKSILLRILAGAIRGYAGQVLFQGKELGDWSRDFFEITGAVLDPAGLAPQLTALEILDCHVRLYRAGNPGAARGALERVGLAAVSRTRVAKLESDQQFLVALARAQLHRPIMLCVDTPPEGLSLATSDRLDDVIHARKAEGLATVLAARDGAWAAGLCGRALRLGGEGTGA